MSRHDKRRATFGLAYLFAPPRAAETTARAFEALRVLQEFQARFMDWVCEVLVEMAGVVAEANRDARLAAAVSDWDKDGDS